MQKEIWKDIPCFRGSYQVSNLGRVRSLDRYYKNALQERNFRKGKIMNQASNKRGYCYLTLCKNGIRKPARVHHLVAAAFLDYKGHGLHSSINHINHNTSDNRVVNLEIISCRENSHKRKTIFSSKYPGVSYNKSMKRKKRWVARIQVNGKNIHLGLHLTEYEAHLAYQKALIELV